MARAADFIMWNCVVKVHSLMAGGHDLYHCLLCFYSLLLPLGTSYLQIEIVHHVLTAT